ncbi:MAG: ABC transporter permease [Bacteroidetes bacterium]|nr:MAG: ABC transporter permease [Bacteroidota bacterium]
MIRTIFKKELLETLRDRRTIITMIVIPTMIFPLIMTVFFKVSDNFTKEASEKTVQIGIVSEEGNSRFIPALQSLPKELGKRAIHVYSDTAQLRNDIGSDSVQIGFFIPSNYAAVFDSSSQVSLRVYYNATKVGMKERAKVLMEAVQTQVKAYRYNKLRIDARQLEPVVAEYENVASVKETVGKLVGGFLPYLFIAFGFMGCMYPAIDLFTGEKERGTLETLLTAPASRWQILIGKMGVVVLSGLIAASFTMLGIFLTIEVFDIIQDPKILDVIHQVLTLKFVLMFYLLLIPLIIFFAGVMIPIAVYAKTFKEAQSIIAPMNAVIVLPAMVGFFPGIELNMTTACIPVVNIVLATKELIAGTLQMPYVLLSFGIMLALASLSIMFSYKRFGKEGNLVT